MSEKLYKKNRNQLKKFNNNIKKYGKKGFSFNNEVLLYMLLGLVLFFFMFFSNNFVVTSANQIKKSSPELSYEYPALFVKGFLMIEVSDINKEKLDFDVKDKIYVHDLIYLGNDEAKEIIEDMKNEYLSNDDVIDSLEQFKVFSNDESLMLDDLLVIEYEVNSIPDLEEEIQDENYVFYFRAIDKNNFRCVYFKKSFVQRREHFMKSDFGI